MAIITLTDGIRAYLLQQSTVTALIGSGTTARLYPVNLPQNPRFPAATIQQVGGTPEYVYGGAAGIEDIRVQITCYGKTEEPDFAGYQDCRDLAAAIRLAISGFAFGDVGALFVVNARDIGVDDRVGVYSHVIDCAAWASDPTL